MPQCQNPTIIECANPSRVMCQNIAGQGCSPADLPRATCPRPLMALVRKIPRKPLEREEIVAILSLVLCNWSLDPTQSTLWQLARTLEACIQTITLRCNPGKVGCFPAGLFRRRLSRSLSSVWYSTRHGFYTIITCVPVWIVCNALLLCLLHWRSGKYLWLACIVWMGSFKSVLLLFITLPSLLFFSKANSLFMK